MGLTIHYNLKTQLTRVEDIRNLVNALRQYALDLPFKEVEDVVEFKGNEVSYDDKDDPHRWLKIQSGQYVDEGGGRLSYSVRPLHIIAFTAYPGDGCEDANFGLCTYPGTIVVPGSKRRLRTNLTGWSWRSFCKTQYSSSPEFGGTPNFLRCHLTVVKLLDFIKKTNFITVEVSDEGEYWEHRNLEKLAREVGSWNEMIAAFVGKFNDAARNVGMGAESAIADFPNFEMLEAKGLERLKASGNRLFEDS